MFTRAILLYLRAYAEGALIDSIVSRLDFEELFDYLKFP